MKKMQNLAVVLAAAALLALTSTSAFAAGWVQDGAEWRYADNNGDFVEEEMKKSGDVTFYLNEDGYMAKDAFVEYKDNYYYFGSNGAMVTNTWVAIDPSIPENNDGAELVDVFWYYFQANGKAFKASDDNDVKKKTIDGKDYFFNGYGQMMTGWFNKDGMFDIEEDDSWYEETGDKYYAGADGVARSGWLAWTDGLIDEASIGYTDISDKTVMYFYFDPSSHKCFVDSSKKKTLNGREYRFNNKGLMYSGWEYYEEDDAATASNMRYFSDETDGHAVKKGWVYTQASEKNDPDEDRDDEYFYFLSTGKAANDGLKKVNNKWYVFDKAGVMKTGLVVLTSQKKYVDCIDMEETEGDMIIKKDLAVTDENSTAHTLGLKDATNILMYFGDDGARVVNSKINIELGDGTYSFGCDTNGAWGVKTVSHKSKYYSNGFLLKGNDDIKFAMVASSANIRKAVSKDTLFANDLTTKYAASVSSATEKVKVVNQSGTVWKGYNAKKDGNGDYWVTDKYGYLVGIFDVKCQWDKGALYFDGDATITKYKNGDIDSQDTDTESIYLDSTVKGAVATIAAGASGTTKTSTETINSHKVVIDDDYCANFYLQ